MECRLWSGVLRDDALSGCRVSRTNHSVADNEHIPQLSRVAECVNPTGMTIVDGVIGRSVVLVSHEKT